MDTLGLNGNNLANLIGSDEINFILKNTPDEEKAILLSLLEMNDIVEFEKQINRIFNIAPKQDDTLDYEAQMQADEYADKSFLSQSASEEASAQIRALSEIETDFNNNVTLNVLQYFTREAQRLENEAKHIESTLLGKPNKISLPEADLKQYLHSANPYIRLMLAAHGLFAEVLKHDVSPAIRLETFNQTGQYSEFYREREDNLDMVKALINQGIDHAYYSSVSEITRKMVLEQQAADKIIETVMAGNDGIIQTLLDRIDWFENSEAIFRKYKPALAHITLVVQSAEIPLNAKSPTK